LLGCVALASCGYQWMAAGRGLPGIASVAIRTPENDSREPGLEYMVADALRRELLRRGGSDLSEDPDSADLVVTGNVRPLEVAPRSFSSVVLAYEYEVTLSVDLVAHRRDGSELPVEASALRESERYLASADVEAQQKNRQEALRRVAQLVAARFFESLSLELAP
jgi:Lipopolysaccharide-assembly